MLFASVLGMAAAGQGENDKDACEEKDDESATCSDHGASPRVINVFFPVLLSL